MPILHMQTDQTRETAQNLTQTAVWVYEQGQSLSRSWAVLSMEWQSPSRIEFEAEIEALIRAVDQLAETCDDLGRRVQQETDQWELVDANGQQRLMGISSGLG